MKMRTERPISTLSMASQATLWATRLTSTSCKGKSKLKHRLLSLLLLPSEPDDNSSLRRVMPMVDEQEGIFPSISINAKTAITDITPNYGKPHKKGPPF